MGMTQRDVVGREVGGGFMFGNAPSFPCGFAVSEPVSRSHKTLGLA